MEGAVARQFRIGGEFNRGAKQKRDGQPGIGYFRASSSVLCAVEDCAILSPLLRKTLLALRQALATGVLPKSLREMEAFAGGTDSQLLLTATFSGFPAHA